jgi:DNA-binding XRE family transcriptional regulator
MPKQENIRPRWTPRLIKQLHGNRSLAGFATLVGATRNTVWRWETGRSQPNATYSKRLSTIAQREHFLKDWKLVGSMTLLGDVEGAHAAIAELFCKSVKRTARQLTDYEQHTNQ